MVAVSFPPDFQTLKTKGAWSLKYSPSNIVLHPTRPVFMMIAYQMRSFIHTCFVFAVSWVMDCMGRSGVGGLA